MTSSEPSASADLTTTAADYDQQYYRSGLGPPYEESEPHWANFFAKVASALVEQVRPARVLDAGCAKGFLVHAFVKLGVDAYGVDVSDYAIREAASAIKDRVRVHDLTQPLDDTYDLITCIEVLEHLAPADCEVAIDNLCRATDHLLLSSTPHDFVEATHVNIRPVADWVASFARRGFYRRTDVDTSVLSPWAVLFERRAMTAADVARMYEIEMSPLREEVVVKTQSLLEVQRQLDEASGDVPIPGGANSLDRVLGLIDQVVGLQAELAEVRFEAEAGASLYPDHDRRSAAWTTGRSPASLASALGLEQELRQSLERRLVELQARAERSEAELDQLRRSRVLRAANTAGHSARARLRALRR